MKRTALFFASTAILFSSPHAMAEQPALNRPYISSNTNVPQMLLAQAESQEPEAEAAEEPVKKPVEEQVDDAKQRAVEESDAAAESQKQAAEQAKEQADQGARDAEAEAAAKAKQAQRDAQAESDKAAEEQKAVEAEAKQKAAEEAAGAEAARKQAAEDAKQAKRDAQAEADKAAEEQKAVGEAARKKATDEAEAAKATEAETAKEAENAKKAAQEETDKAAEAQKSAEEEARKKTDRAQKAADKQSEKAAEDAKKAADKAVKETPTKETAPQAGEQAPKPAAVPNQPKSGETEAPAQEAKPAQPDQETKPADGTTAAPAETAKPEQQEASPLPENAAPVLDSDKPVKGGREGKGRGGKRDQVTGKGPVEQPSAEAPATPPVAPPKTDADVQQELAPVKIEPVRTEKGTRTKERRRDERPDDVQVIKQFDNRTIVEVNNNVFVESSDRPRMSRDAQDVYYEDLPRNRTRETIVRDNGVQIITVRNRYGDVIQRSRVMPDGREVVLSYAPDYDREERVEWRDPGDDLPPLRLTIPVREYIMDAEEAPEEDVYEFFAQPPVERVERLYSVDEVKRSARIRDKVRRVDLDTITFPFGSAEIGEDQITRIESVAKAMAQTLKKNPAETFLIEGHTDAVGSDQANLVLSDKRAESVAQALTNVFDIPPENMATQGYGESYLKIKSDGPEQQNRRVAIRRITPLVAPLASNK
ncbi:OmpA family protein [Phyllobacterium sp. SB3]|uniref:OmpA family protein n=1 Tax=Phyllobacterium sp. SB3 TaxID=3156073 RepID=UPI0032AF1289